METCPHALWSCIKVLPAAAKRNRTKAATFQRQYCTKKRFHFTLACLQVLQSKALHAAAKRCTLEAVEIWSAEDLVPDLRPASPGFDPLLW